MKPFAALVSIILVASIEFILLSKLPKPYSKKETPSLRVGEPIRDYIFHTPIPDYTPNPDIIPPSQP